jgi:hypothetical protein
MGWILLVALAGCSGSAAPDQPSDLSPAVTDMARMQPADMQMVVDMQPADMPVVVDMPLLLDLTPLADLTALVDLMPLADLMPLSDLGGPHDLYVDPVGGADSNPGTQAMPYKTIGGAAAHAGAGDTVKLLAGTWDAGVEPGFAGSGVTIPAGVAVQAVTPGTVTLAGMLLFAGGGSASDLTFQGGAPGISASAGNFALSGVRFLTENSNGSLQLSGTVTATWVPGGAADYGSVNSLAVLAGSATLTVTGGKMASVTWGGVDTCPAFFKATVSSTLTLDGLTFDTNQVGAVSATGSANVTIKNATLHNSSRPTSGSFCTAPVFIGGTAAVDIQGTQITNNPAPGIRIGGPGNNSTLKVSATSVIDNNDYGIWSPTGAHPASVTLANTDISNNANGGVKLDSGTFALDVRGCTITGNLVNHGLLDYYDGSGASTIYMRNTTITGNSNSNGLRILGTATGNYDFGTVADPGNNTFQGNSLVSGGATECYFAVANVTLINAIGNTWDPNVGGADATGHYVPSGGNPYVQSSASQFPNYTLEQFGGGACFIRL